MRLSDVRPGEACRVVGWIGEDVPDRIMEMGVLPGTEVVVVRLAPFGDPIDLKLRGYHLSIRKHEAEHIEVERV